MRKGGDKLTLSVTGPTATSPPNLNSPKPAEDTANVKRCATPVTVTFFGHSDEGILEKVIISPEDKKNKPLSLPGVEIPDLLSFENIPNDAKSPNSIFGSETRASNPFLNFTVTEEVKNPFHDANSNPFLANNPFRTEENNTPAVNNKQEEENCNEPKNNDAVSSSTCFRYFSPLPRCLLV